ncbi:MAG: SCO family protein [Bdellovibrionaceae bacterium]|nr:SCO family protein [Pseudobdellovibrionaceae bacterium]
MIRRVRFMNILSSVLLVFGAIVLASMAARADRRSLPAYDGKPQPKVADERPAELEGVGITEQLGAQLNLDLPFRDEEGREVRLRDYINGTKPVIISPVYFSCPGLCNFHLNGLTDALKELDWTVGKDFDVLAISFDSNETPEVAKGKKENYVASYGRPESASGWHFLTGSAESVKSFTDSIGFKYKWNEEQQEWSHASAAIMVSPQGVLTRYLPGIMFAAKDVKLALTEAGKGKVGTFIDQLVLYCFHYNPKNSGYSIYAFNIMKLAGGITVLLLAIWLIPFWYRSRKESELRS